MDEISELIIRRTRKDNVSMQLLFPCLQIDGNLVRQFPEFGFVNTYLTWDKCEYNFPVIYVVFRAEFTMPFYHFITQLEKNKNYIETIDEPGAVVLVYKVPQVFHEDYCKFIFGKYSQCSKEYKACFPMSVPAIDEKTGAPERYNGKYIKQPTEFYHIFNKTKNLRDRWSEALGVDLTEDVELYDRPNMEKETLQL